MLFYFLFYTDGDLRTFTLLFYVVLFLVFLCDLGVDEVRVFEVNHKEKQQQKQLQTLAPHQLPNHKEKQQQKQLQTLAVFVVVFLCDLGVDEVRVFEVVVVVV
jgi:6-phosphogluconolactonase (cycloisomerase 2 family)